MRTSGAFFLFLIFLLPPCLRAQNQEQKLVDRLLKPDTTLQNPGQNKKFAAATSAQDRQAHVEKFNWEEKNRAKTFSNTRDFSSREFYSRSFYNTKDPTSLIQKTPPKSDLAFGTQVATGVRAAADSAKKAEQRDFAGNRPFLDEGKSQKALSQRDRPMTIEEVRQLLNKNK